VLPSTRSSGKGIPEIAHRDYEIVIQPDAPSFYGEIWDFPTFSTGNWWYFVRQWLTQDADELLIDRRDLSTVPVGVADVQPVPTVQGDQLSDLVIAETGGRTTEVFDQAAGMTEAESLIWALNQPGVTFEEITLIRNRLADLGVTGGLEPTLMERAEDILLTPVQDVEVGEVADFFDDLGDVIVGAASTYLSGMAAPQQFGPSSAPIGSTVPMPSQPATVMSSVPGSPAVACDTKCGPYPVYKMVCGVYKWVYPKRRRRRQLLTETDYNGLLRIEGLKVNKNMTVALSKALTR